jgi:viroplasmin and RNaseH domain-containing protein
VSKLGEWKLTCTSRVIAVSSGVIAVEEKDKDALADFSLKYAWLVKAIKENPRKSEYKMDKWSPVTLRKACKENKLDKLGQMEKITRTVDLLTDEKRTYLNPPKNGRMLLHSKYKSIPMDISVVMNKSVEEDEDED